jgi:hypothetical protein
LPQKLGEYTGSGKLYELWKDTVTGEILKQRKEEFQVTGNNDAFLQRVLYFRQNPTTEKLTFSNLVLSLTLERILTSLLEHNFPHRTALRCQTQRKTRLT